MKKTIIAALLAITAATAPAQVNRTQALINAALKGWDIELRMGYNLGGTSPIPLPEEIRKIDSYSPGLPLSFEANFIKRFDADKKWGLLFGAKVETKAMETKATVKNYGMEIIGDDGARVSACRPPSRTITSHSPYSAHTAYTRAQTSRPEYTCHT